MFRVSCRCLKTALGVHSTERAQQDAGMRWGGTGALLQHAHPQDTQRTSLERLIALGLGLLSFLSLLGVNLKLTHHMTCAT